MRRTIDVCTICLLPWIVVSIGCGGGGPVKPADLPPLFPCTVTFMQDGTPLDGATFSFKSNDPTFKWSVGGRTDKEGKAVITTNGVHKGAPEGTYKVTVRKIAVLESRGENVKRADVVDPQLQKADTTTLEITIAKGKNEQTLDVGKAVNIVLSDE